MPSPSDVGSTPIYGLPAAADNSPGCDAAAAPACNSKCADGCGESCGCGDSCCDCCCGAAGLLPCCSGEPKAYLQELLFGDCCDPPFTIGGWTQIGYHNEQTPLSGSFGDVLAFNDVPDQLNLHQQWLYVERVADGSGGFDFGGRVDVMYGTDAQKTQSFGNDPGEFDFQNGLDFGEYGWAIPQLYAEVAYCDWSVIVGHFYTLVGYEVVTAPDNFFYSHSLTMFNSEPFTHTGVLATYSGFEDVEVYGGWTLGWDTGFDQSNGGSSFLGGFSTNLSENVAFTYIATAGNFGARSGGEGGYSHSLVFDVALSDSLNYVLQSDLVAIDNPGIGANDQVGINQYLFYTLSDCVAV
ncbi:MAG: outer membrane beta-barrel protein, partial [Planctomycetota bacterium]